MQKPLSSYLSESPVFTYELTIRVNRKTYIDRIVAFEQAFLRIGEEYGMFVAVPFKENINLSIEPLLEKYGKERYLSIEQRKTERLRLLNVEESKYFRNRVRYLGLDIRGAEFEDDITVAPVNHDDELEHRSALKMMELLPGPGLDYEDLMDEFYWEEDLRVRIKSSANIWLEEITNEAGDTTDNRAVAGRVLPVFNAWLKELEALVKAEKGSLKLI
ncbi:hypothetical protein FUA23_01770 [Neolewinella aurantiaca]|uniref:Uncharacterized protein n=1 Tax=Neolewinella aurantiaca TaxID=2602767 RepID=A0A5C7FL73_9BACT|nr:hypothetical protein [Neolewinella aurantiaca]TXF91447.1 hypothetical protein FUA23_01770 [Neolewinella aurantiaca]